MDLGFGVGGGFDCGRIGGGGGSAGDGGAEGQTPSEAFQTG